MRGDIPSAVGDGSILSIERLQGSSDSIHSIGGHPARFIPEIPRWALLRYAKPGDVVLDPFCGSGTTLVEARAQGCDAIGIDNNPVAILISKVKSRNIDLELANEKLEAVLNIVNSEIGNEIELPYVTNRDFWFDIPVSNALMKIRTAIQETCKGEVRELLLVCFSDIIRSVSHVAPGQILQARRPGHHEQKTLSESDVIREFENKCESHFKTLYTSFSSSTRSLVLNPNDTCPEPDLVITSPPYINAVDYIWAYKLRMEWLGLVGSQKERLELSTTEIGTERIFKDDYVKNFDTGISQLDAKLQEIRLGVNYKAGEGQNELRAQVTRKYFEDMGAHFENMSSIMKCGSKYCLVIGDSSICKTQIPTSEYLITIAERFGFTVIKQFKVILKNRTLNVPRDVEWADIIEHDNVIVFERS